MANIQRDFAAVCAEYDDQCQPRQVEIVRSGGAFSGAMLWRLNTDRGVMCVRRWPSLSPSPSRLHWIHDVIRSAVRCGFPHLPVPIATRSGRSFVEHGNHLWELAPWLPGESDHPEQPARQSSVARIAAAACALAQFHAAVAAAFAPLRCQRPPGLQQRIQQLAALSAGGLEELQQSIAANRGLWPQLADQSADLISRVRSLLGVVMGRAQSAANCEVPLQPSLRDIHREHVLFSGDCVTGIVDFGAMRVETIAGDVARLLASMAIEDNALWACGITAYEQIRPLGDDERRLIVSYHETATLLSGIHWLEWVFVDEKQFENRRAVEERFALIRSRLTALGGR